MKTNESVHVEDMKLMEISHLKTAIKEIYNQKGPGSSDYITLKIKLDLLVNEYLEDKIKVLI